MLLCSLLQRIYNSYITFQWGDYAILSIPKSGEGNKAATILRANSVYSFFFFYVQSPELILPPYDKMQETTVSCWCSMPVAPGPGLPATSAITLLLMCRTVNSFLSCKPYLNNLSAQWGKGRVWQRRENFFLPPTQTAYSYLFMLCIWHKYILIFHLN